MLTTECKAQKTTSSSGAGSLQISKEDNALECSQDAEVNLQQALGTLVADVCAQSLEADQSSLQRTHGVPLPAA